MPPANGNGGRQSVLRFERVTVKFDDEPALVDVSFDALKGDTRVILGAAGSGKTVLLKTSLGLVKPDSGSVYVFGQDVARMDEEQLHDVRAKMGMLFQESALFDSLSIEENVGYPLENQKAIQVPPEEVRSRVEEALRFVELEETLEKAPSELSGGMRRGLLSLVRWSRNHLSCSMTRRRQVWTLSRLTRSWC